MGDPTQNEAIIMMGRRSPPLYRRADLLYRMHSSVHVDTSTCVCVYICRKYKLHRCRVWWFGHGVVVAVVLVALVVLVLLVALAIMLVVYGGAGGSG